MEKKVRMADIAQRLGISIVSVSKGLAGKDGVSPEMRAKIIATAQEMGYVLPQAKEEEKKLLGNIGILVADRFVADNAFYPNLYRQVLVRCNEAGFSAMLEIVSPEAERGCVLPAMIQGKKVDGLIFMGELNRGYLRMVMQAGLPYMLLDFYDDALDADSVTSDNVTGGYRLTSHLLQTGRRDIAFVGSIFATSSIMDRYLGYYKALIRAGITPQKEWRLEDRDGDGMFIPLELPEHMPQAFVCNCDEVGYNLVELLKRKGYRVPQDVAVTGYDDYQFAQICDPQLTTYRVDVEGMGRMVVAQLIRKINGKRVTGGNVVRGTFVKRQST
ncbi:MAG: LacI family DNA-binding transcriptional regulator [Faecousia sp.]